MDLIADQKLGNLVYREFFQGPCKCCGSNEHGILMQDFLADGTMKINLACSVTKHVLVSQAFQSSKIDPSFEKIAHVHSHHVESVNESMKGFRKDGYGKHMSYMQLVDFENDLFRYCIDVRKEVHLKRYVAPMENERETDGSMEYMG